MLVGINCHPVHGNEPVELVRFDTVRYPVWKGKSVKKYQAFTSGAKSLGIEPLIVCDSTSLAVADTYEKSFKLLLKRYPQAKYWQIGNEADQQGSDSSWYMSPSEYRELLKIGSGVLGGDGRVLLSSGMVSGDPHYLEQVAYFPFDKLCIHPYGQYPYRKNAVWAGEGFGDVCDLLDSYIRVLGAVWRFKIWITEFGIPNSAFNSIQGESDSREAYYQDMLVELSDWGVEAALPYCWDCSQCQELMIKGLVRI